jgi:hypothetical protein
MGTAQESCTEAGQSFAVGNSSSLSVTAFETTVVEIPSSFSAT